MNTRFVEVAADQDAGDVARQLISIAEAEGLEQPGTDTGGERIRFVVSKELWESYQGAPSASLDVSDESGDSDEAGKSRRRKKSKGE